MLKLMCAITIACFSMEITRTKINVTSVMPIDMKKVGTKLHAKFCIIFQ